MENLLARKIIEQFNNVKKTDHLSVNSIIHTFRDSLFGIDLNLANFMPKNLESDEINFKSFDDLNLKGRVIRTENSKKWIIMLHGYSISSDIMVPFGLFTRQFGYNLFLFDFRNHGESDESITTLGINEKKDLESAIEYLHTNYDVESIGLFGVSMGAFTLNYFALSSEEFIKKNKVHFGISDASYHDIYSLISNFVGEKIPLLANVAKGMIDDITKIYQDDYKVDLKSGDCGVLSKKCQNTFPTLFIHAENDKLISYHCSEQLYEERKKIVGAQNDELKLFADGSHGRSFLVNNQEYIETVKAFLTLIGEI